MWNTATLGRYVWAISVKKDSMWLKWVNEIFKNADWWGYSPPVESSRYWKALCAVKEHLINIMSHLTTSVGEGC